MKDENIIYIQYARKSSEGENRQTLSIPAQLRDLDEKILSKQNLTIYKTIIDEASASIPYNRSGYTEMIKLIKSGKVNGIIVWHIDRIVRNELEDGEFRWLLRTGKIQSIMTPTREYRSEDNTLLLGIETSMASQYTIDLSRKVRNGNKEMWQRGQPGGFAKLGYLNTKFQEHGSNYLIKDPERFYIIRKAFDLLLSGKYDVPQIHAKLKTEYGLVTRKTKKLGGKPVALSVLYRMFADPFYSGIFYRHGALYKGAYPAMITIEEYHQIQKILRRPFKSQPQKHEFAFTGLMKCGSCGCAITATKKLKFVQATGQYKTYTFYHCSKRKGNGACTEKQYTTEKEMLNSIIAEIVKLNLIPKMKEWAVHTIQEDYEFELSKDKEFLKKTCDYERKLNQEIDRVLDLHISNEISKEQYQQKKAERQVELLMVQEKIKRLHLGIEYQQEQINKILDFAENVTERFLMADPIEQKSICSYFGWNWTLHEKKLSFTRQEWFFDLEELNAYYEANKEALEPIKSFIELRKSPYFEKIILTLRRMWEHIRTIPNSQVF